MPALEHGGAGRDGTVMRIPRAMLGALLWLVAALLGLVAILLCVTVLLLPLGIPLLMLSRRLFTQSVRLMLPRSLAHPVQGLEKKGKEAKSSITKTAGKKAKKGKKIARRQRKRLG